MGNRGYFGVAAWHPKHEVNVGSLWRTADAYGGAFTATVGMRYAHQAADTTKTRLHTPMHHYADMDDLIAHLPHGCPIVGVELDPRAESLDTFWHPPRALYLLGAEDHGLSPNVLDRCHKLISVPTNGPFSLNVAVAGSIVLAHRHMQNLPGERTLDGSPRTGAVSALPPA